MTTDKLRRFDLTKDRALGDWKLQESGAGQEIGRWRYKRDATRTGVLFAAIGGAGGSVRIHKLDGTIEEERTFPRNRDPKGSKG